MTAKKKSTRSRGKQPEKLTLSDVWLRVVVIEQHLYEMHGTRNLGTSFSVAETRRDLADINARLDEQKEVLTELSRTLDRLDDFTREQIFHEVYDMHTRLQRRPWHVRCWDWMREVAGDWYFALVNLIKGLAR